MNISLEYLQRTGVLREIATYPCSLFITNPMGHKYALVIDKRKESFILRKWEISTASAEHSLPTLNERVVDELIDSDVIPIGHLVFTCRTKSIPSQENGVTHPMSHARYCEYFDSICARNFEKHNEAKKRWLWAEFVSVYRPELHMYSMSVRRSMGFHSFYGEAEIFNDQQQIVEQHFQRDWICWDLWCRHMLDFEGIPGEYLFKSYLGANNGDSLLGSGM